MPTPYYVKVARLNGRDKPSTHAHINVVRSYGDVIEIVRIERADDGFRWGLSTGGNWWRMGYLSKERQPERIPSPLPGGVVTTPWGKKPKDNTYWQTRGRHTGSDYNIASGDAGKPVVAVKAGRVVRRTDRVLGNIALLYTTDKQGRPVTFWFCHLSRITRTGRVKAGDQIGTVGSTGTGAVRGPHLHFEVRKGHTASWRGRDYNPVGVW